MSDYYQPTPFAIVAASRSGGTFLTHCLDSHPQVSCERDSPLDEAGPWLTWLDVSERAILRALWGRGGYRAAVLWTAVWAEIWPHIERKFDDRPKSSGFHRRGEPPSSIIRTAGEFQENRSERR